MATRSAKDWLENTMLDEDDMISDSATDVASQQSIKKYTDDAEAAAIATANAYTDAAVSGLATEAYVDAAEADANSYTDSAVTGLATEAYADQAEADAITSANSYTDAAVSGLATEAYVDQAEADANTYTDNAVSGLATEAYADQAEADAISTANAYTDSEISDQHNYGDVGSPYPDDVEIFRVSGSDNVVTVKSDTTVSGTADGLKIEGTTNAGLKLSAATGNTYLVMESDQTIDTAQIKITHPEAHDEWHITSAGTNHDLSIRAIDDNNPRTYSLLCDNSTGHVALFSNTVSATTPLRIGANTLPIFADVFSAKIAGLEDGDVFRRDTDGALMIVYT